MNCYGKYYGKRVQCAECKLKRHCVKAGDLPLLSQTETPEWLMEEILSGHATRLKNNYAGAEKDRRYTRADLLEVIVFMAALDFRTLTLISTKLKEPTLNLSQLAEKRCVSRQAVHKAIRQRIDRIPELSAVFTYRKHKNKGQVGQVKPVA